MDVSGLKKMHIIGPHAEALINFATTRNVSKLYPGKSVYACMLNEAGKFIDDCVIYRNGPNAFMVVHGSGAGHEILTRGAVGRNVVVLFDDDLHDLSLQGRRRWISWPSTCRASAICPTSTTCRRPCSAVR
jgi:aminomethyltransferase